MGSGQGFRFLQKSLAGVGESLINRGIGFRLMNQYLLTPVAFVALTLLSQAVIISDDSSVMKSSPVPDQSPVRQISPDTPPVGDPLAAGKFPQEQGVQLEEKTLYELVLEKLDLIGAVLETGWSQQTFSTLEFALTQTKAPADRTQGIFDEGSVEDSPIATPCRDQPDGFATWNGYYFWEELSREGPTQWGQWADHEAVDTQGAGQDLVDPLLSNTNDLEISDPSKLMLIKQPRARKGAR